LEKEETVDRGISEIIGRVLGKVGSAMSVEDILGYSLQELRDVTNCQSCGIVTVDEDGTIRVKNSRGLSGEFVKRLHSMKKMALVEDVISSKGPLLIDRAHPKFNKEGYSFENPYQALFAVPLIIGKKAIGTLFLDSRGADAFPQGVREEINELAALLAIITYQGILEDSLAEASNYDPLTSLYNYRYFHEELAREIRRAKLHNERVTILLASIGHIDEYNAMHGHPEGDRAIVALSEIVKRQLRPIDMPSRYSNKFAVIFPGLDKSNAEDVARKVCSEMGKNPVGREPALTIRIGIASCPADASDLNGLINIAEKNLYESKRKGGNSYTA
jgi:diguanylate cyclase (GGDEF)-like protein